MDVASGDCVAVLSGQSDGITAISFTPDCRRLILVSFSGCVFVWRLSTLLTKRMLSKLSRLSPHLGLLNGIGENDRCVLNFKHNPTDSKDYLRPKSRQSVGICAEGTNFY